MDKKYIYVTVFLIIIAVAGGIFVASSNKSEQNLPLESSTPSATITGVLGEISSPSASPSMENKLVIVDETVGTGDAAVNGKKVTVNYVGTLTDGTKFDSSYDRNQPFTFTLGAGEVIKGWDQGVVGMKVGGKRKLTIPSGLAYGDAGVPGTIPAGATLIFEVELLKVE